jgi:hypothetical protein
MSSSHPPVCWSGFQVWTLACSLPLLSALAGCAGTPWGDTLSGSFPTPPVQATAEQQAPQAPKGVEVETSTAKTAGPALAPQSSPSPAASPAPGAKARESLAPKPVAPKPVAPKPKPPSVATAPSPYRVTIRLPQADPSAPAEGVTEALRMAGIPFEVETIERVKGASPQPVETPPPAPVSSPSVRPAPPPR